MQAKSQESVARPAISGELPGKQAATCRRAASTARRAMAPTESGGAAAIRAAAGDLALAYAWTVVCFRAWDDALER